MKRLVLLAGCLACGLTMNATAAISPGLSDGASSDPAGELFLTVWDPVNQVSYTRDLGIDVPSTDFSSATFSFGADALFNSTFGSNTAGLEYSIVGSNQQVGFFQPDPAAQGLQVALTSNSDSALVLALGTGPTGEADIQGFATRIRQYASGNNALSGSTDPSADLSNTALPGSEGYYGNELVFNGNLAGLLGQVTTGANVGESLSFYLLGFAADSSGFGFDPNTQLNQQFAGIWTLGSDGSLSYAPIPIPAGIWLLGSALLGLVGVARRKRAAVANA